MVLRIVVTVLLVILAFIVYLIFIPIGFALKADFDEKTFRVSLHDPLRFIDAGYDTSRKKKLSIRLFFLFSPEKKKSDGKKPDHKKKKKRQKKKKKKPEGRKKLLDFLKKKSGVILKSVTGFLKSCHIHIDRCDVSFSSGEPDTSALIYGALSSLPFMYTDAVHLECDLLSDDAFLRGRLCVRGRLHLILVIYYALKILFTGDRK